MFSGESIYLVQIFQAFTEKGSCSNASKCIFGQKEEDSACVIGCHGLYADVSYENSTSDTARDMDLFYELEKEYQKYKDTFVENLVFEPESINYSK